jgi:hypothetical protein
MRAKGGRKSDEAKTILVMVSTGQDSDFVFSDLIDQPMRIINPA